MKRRLSWLSVVAAMLPGVAQAAEVSIQGVYGTREVCEEIAKNGNPAKAFRNEQMDPIVLARDGYDDIRMSCAFDVVSTPQGPVVEEIRRWTANATCKDETSTYKSTFRLTEHLDSKIVSINQDDDKPFTLHLCEPVAAPAK